MTLTFFVALTEAARGFGPKVGRPREDVRVEVPDSGDPHRAARDAAVRDYAGRHGLSAAQVWIFGLYGGGRTS